MSKAQVSFWIGWVLVEARPVHIGSIMIEHFYELIESPPHSVSIPQLTNFAFSQILEITT